MRPGVAVARIFRRQSCASWRRSVPETIWSSLSRLRRQRGSLGGRGVGSGDEAEQVALASRTIEEQDQRDPRAFQQGAKGLGIHPPQTGGLLTGATLSKGAMLRSGISVDQMIASRMGQETLQPSMVLACEQPITGFHESNYSMAYSSHISWASPDSPVPNEIYPSLAFDMLFENRGSLLNLSILDRVKGRAERLSRKISSSDNAKLDEFMTGVREVEKRVEGMRKAKEKADDLAELKNLPTPLM